MRRPQVCAALVLVLLGLAVAASLATTSNVISQPSRKAGFVASLPLAFEPAGDGGYVSHGPGYSLSLTASDAVIGVRGGSFRLRPAGPAAGPAPTLVPGEPLGATVTRLAGNDPGRWTSGVQAYGRVLVRQPWPGVDMVWHGDQRRLQHDMVVAPGVDPTVVVLDVDGARSLTIGPSGDLVVELPGAQARLARPVLYQDVDGGRRPVDGAFALLGPSRIGFSVGAYDRSRPLVIDPTLVTSTLLGGGGNDSGYAIAVDAQGNTYVTGSTESTDFPSATPLQPGLANAATGPTSDVFVSKLSPDGSRLVWSTYLGGSGRDTGYAIAVGADGTVYVAGVTESSDFPRARGAQETYGGGPSDAFVAKIAANGTALEWSTFVGGSQTDRARGLALDGPGNAYVVGSSNSAEFPAVNAYQPGPYRTEDVDAFLVKVPSAGGPFSYSTRVGGSNDDRALDVAVDGQANAYVTGDTLSPGFPTVRPLQPASGGSPGGVAGSFADAFVAKFNPTGGALVYSTFLGGSDVDQATSIAVDGQGAAYVVGNTTSTNFPTAGGPQQAQRGGEADAFVAKIDPQGAALAYSTYYGGSGADGANAVALDATGNAHVVGTTGSANWPTNRPVQGSRGGPEDAFLLRLDTAGKAAFSTFVGGRETDAGMGVAVDAQGGVRMLGLSGSADFPSVRPVSGARPAAGGDAFVATLNLADTAPASSTPSAAAPAPTSTASSSSSAHDRRVRLFGGLTLLLLLAAVAQTVYLKRRPAPATIPARRKSSAAPGLKVLGDTAKRTTPTKAAATKSTRTPKARGGPKGGPQKAAKATTPAVPAPAPEELPTEVRTPPAPKPKRQEPAIAQLLEEDMWAPEVDDDQVVEDEAPVVEAPVEAPPAEPAPVEPAPLEPAPVEPEPRPEPRPEAAAPPPPPPQPVGPEPAPVVPPVPAEELSFWDLFPEDLPPARPASVPVDNLLIDPLALPEGPDSNAARFVDPEPDPFEPPGVPPPPPEAEIVIAELLDGPPPSNVRAVPESPWAPEDIVIDDLLADQPLDRADGADADDDDDAPATAPAGTLSKEEQARIAADRARRRRNRRSGRRRPGGGSG